MATDAAGGVQEQLAATNLNSSSHVAPYSATYGRTPVKSLLLAADGGKSMVGTTLRIGGWVKTGREAGAGAFAFLEINDGSCFGSLQVMVTKEVGEEVGGLKKLVPTGTCVLIEGLLAETPEGTKQAVELKACKVLHLGPCEAAVYPMAKKKQSMEFLREKAHLRSRTNTIGAVARIRNALSFATHSFFQENGFVYVHTPIITASDCEGAGEMFQVTTLLNKKEDKEQQQQQQPPSAEQLQQLREQVSAQGSAVKEAKAAAAADKSDSGLAAASKAALDRLLAAKKQLAEAEEAALWVGGIKRTAAGDIDYSQDFFGRPAFLTVSGQLQGEYYACGLTSVYTFGPTFRAENSHTSRHLAEFWMIEPEIAFCNLEVRGGGCRVHSEDDDPKAIERLQHVANSNFARCSYTEGIELLQKAVAEGRKFEDMDVHWGIDLATEHERYLAEEVFKQPVIVYNYPKDIKAFYMRLNDDNKTVAAMDVLVPKVGELIGGSQREDRVEVLESRMAEMGVNVDDAYMDLRRFGSVPHAGFGLGFERLIMFATGIDNIRDVIPFPRWPGNVAF
ncbi:hypothetical protein COO60DRAFT_1702131 [Scenedesmus sp. NREL 46B-D3]|nr:hypothetical protein COO60DRAFT_1702131 [Scenedesmus sp. NREL 46B-D3]